MSQWLQLNGFSPVWILSCSFKSAFCTNFVSQWGQLNGFPPVWIPLMLSQVVHLYKFRVTMLTAEWLSRVWMLPSSLKCYFFTNFMSQQGQLNGLSPLWVHSCSQVVLLYQFRVTTRTGEWLFSSMNSFMLSQVVLLYQFGVTMLTAEWLFLSMNSSMLSQVLLLYKFHVTTRTAEWLFSSMNSFMLSKVILLNKFRVITRTAEWPFSSLNSFMLSQVVLL